MNKLDLIYKMIFAMVPDLEQIEPGEGVKLTASGFMDLSINVLYREEGRTTISMIHYYKQNGDLVPDPDMEMRLYHKHKIAEALSYQDIYNYQVVYPEPNKVYPKLREQLNQFLYQWLKNIKMQVHKLPD